MRMLTLALMAVLSSALCACAKRPGVTALPPLVTYSKQFQVDLKSELPQVRSCCPRTNTVVKDYSKLRDMIRKGNEVQQNR